MDKSYNAPGFEFDHVHGDLSRTRLSSFCQTHFIGAFDCAKVHNALEDLVVQSGGSTLNPSNYSGPACNPAQRGEQRRMFMSKFPAVAFHPDFAGGVITHDYLDANAMTWPFSGAYEGAAWRTLLREIVHLPGDGRADHGERTGVAVDVGANLGNFIEELIEASSSPNPWSMHLYEPDPDMIANLRRRVGEWPNQHSFSIHEVAISDVKESKATMFFPNWTKNAAQPHPHGAFGKNVFLWKEGNATYTKNVKVTTLDDEYVGKGGGVDILKIDVEGHDVAVLRGGQRMLEEGRVGVLLFEYG
eukprot:CAMPEP_0118632862 /NCGR_PEP_ID=MMETSP0785-20121206/680_1 /TAXON_ID=91992 /ORGANISM="Bolidomonas pacifica, Strain CCMP 1866" /LENGTH=301 /DNA_ID=CAMNT_0006523679 /DNA_START=186 /DNA_END=1087 /DNA_ORIENTATION=+